jgi:uncharacterized protein (TIGR03382 family)
MPGSGASGGQLWINVSSHASMPFSMFTLKETPTPTPGALALLAVAALSLCTRRRH